MPASLCLTVRFLDPVPTFHGRGDGGKPEWPPSPLRLFQSLVAAAAARWRGSQFTELAQPALKWLEGRTPVIVADGIQTQRTPYRMYVPHNAGDLMTAAWERGDTDASMAKHRIEKDIRPTRLVAEKNELGTVRYLYEIADTAHFETIQKTVTAAARSITHLGWGIDMVIGDASIIDDAAAANLPGERWLPASGGPTRLRMPCEGSFNGLIRKHEAFINRLGADGFKPVPPLSEFEVMGYRSATDAIPRPFVVFQLFTDEDERFSYPQDKLIHIAGMVRHLAIDSMNASPPPGVQDDWVKTYVAGHPKPGEVTHRQFSYLPLPSIGHFHTDPCVRRVMVAAPVDDERYLNHLAMLLSGRQLEPTEETRLPNPPTLVRIKGRSDSDKVSNCYTDANDTWASVTPVILPGHDDHKPDKTRRLIEKALQQSGIDQPCEFEWSAFSHFPKSLTAHKYDRHKRPKGYIRPDHLLNLTAIHMRLKFEHPIAGPLAIGAGRHCGLGIFAGVKA
jgi:CRISPR-associated protein Csb2